MRNQDDGVMGAHRDKELSRAFAARCEEVRTTLKAHMHARGMHLEDGWRIHEALRHDDGRTILVMTPIHSRLPIPTDLECTCSIDEAGSDISSQCDP